MNCLAIEKKWQSSFVFALQIAVYVHDTDGGRRRCASNCFFVPLRLMFERESRETPHSDQVAFQLAHLSTNRVNAGEQKPEQKPLYLRVES